MGLTRTHLHLFSSLSPLSNQPSLGVIRDETESREGPFVLKIFAFLTSLLPCFCCLDVLVRRVGVFFLLSLTFSLPLFVCSHFPKPYSPMSPVFCPCSHLPPRASQKYAEDELGVHIYEYVGDISPCKQA